MINLVLAGGRSTRLYNKVMMSMCDGRPLICSAIDQYLDAGVRPIIYTDPVRKMVLGNVLKHLYPITKIEDIRTDNYSGIPKLLYELNSLDDLCVLCGDNIYPPGFYKKVQLGEAACIFSGDKSLDGYDLANKAWVSREAETKVRLVTPWKFRRNSIKGVSENTSLIAVLNSVKLSPQFVGSCGWYDLGTEDKLEAYYAGCREE